jgi:hypothetical protein
VAQWNAGWPTDPQPFVGGREPLEPRKLPPSITAVPVNDPPYEHEGRWPGTAFVLAALWQPPDPAPVIRGSLSPGIPRQSVDPPPASHAGRSVGAAEIAILAQPDPWTHSFEGGSQAFAPRWLNPQLIAVEVDNPPFPGWRVIVAMPPPAAAGALPFVPRPVPQGAAAGAAAQTPFAPGWLATVLAIWGSADPATSPARRLSPSISAVEVDNPPFAHPGRTLLFQAEAALLAQPDPWTYTFAGAFEPYQPRTLSPGTPGQSIDPPPPASLKATAAGIAVGWIPPDPAPITAGRLSPGIPGQSADPPRVPRNLGLDAALRPADPIVLPQRAGLSPGIPGQSVGNPPGLRLFVPAPVEPATLPLLPRTLAPGIPGQSVDRSPGLARLGQPAWPDLPPALPSLPPKLVQAAAAAVSAFVPYTRPWLALVLSLWAAEPTRFDETMRRRLVQAFFAAAAPDPSRLLISPTQRVRLLAGEELRVRQVTSPTQRVRTLP